jgi:hypothetical protein
MVGIVALVAAFAGISYGVVNNYLTSKNLTKTVELVTENTGLNFKDFQKSLRALAKMVLDYHLALDLLLAEQGGEVLLQTPPAAHMLITLGWQRKGQTEYFNKQNGLRNSHYSRGVILGMESDQDMVTHCYLVPSPSRAIISYSPTPHL